MQKSPLLRLTRENQDNGQDAEAADLQARLIAVAANVFNDTMHLYLRALTELWYPESYDDWLPAVANTTTRITWNLPDTSRISQILLMPTAAGYPSRVDVTVDAFRHVPFSLTAQQPKVGPFKHRLFGGTDIIITNADPTINAEVYIEMEIVRYERGPIRTDA